MNIFFRFCCYLFSALFISAVFFCHKDHPSQKHLFIPEQENKVALYRRKQKYKRHKKARNISCFYAAKEMKAQTFAVFFFLLGKLCFANTISQFIRPFYDDKTNNRQAEKDDQILTVRYKYNETVPLNEFYDFLAVDFAEKGKSQKVAVVFENVPLKYSNESKLNSFFNKISWSPISSVDLDNLGFWIANDKNEVAIEFDLIPLGENFKGFMFYISLEKLQSNLLPLSIIHLIVYLTGFITLICLMLLFAYKKLLQSNIMSGAETVKVKTE